MNAVTFLQLAPEFGNTKYGPFRGAEIRLGSDPASNDIAMPEDVGVLAQHVKIIQQNETTFIVAPVDRTATVFIWRANSSKPKQISTPIAVGVGDGFSLVSPEGYRFYIQTENLQKQRESAGGSFKDKAMKRMPTSRGLLEEVKRRGFAKVFTTRLGNSAMYAYRFIITGQIFSPMYIVAGIMMVSGWFFATGATCSAFSLNMSANDLGQKLSECQDAAAGVENGGNNESLPSITTQVQQVNSLKETLREDQSLNRAYADALKLAFGEPQEYSSHYLRSNGDFARLYGGLKRKWSPALVDTVAYAAATKGRVKKSWNVVVDSEGSDVCGRGPLRLTYRQAVNLGLENVQLDALVTESVAISGAKQEKLELLGRTAAAAGVEEMDTLGITINPGDDAVVTGRRRCMHVEGEDDREDIGKLVKALDAAIGPSGAKLPQENGPYWLAYRLFKLGAMDFVNYEDLRFDATNLPPSQYLAGQDGVGKRRATWATDYAGRVMAQAVVTRCGAVLDKQTIDTPPEHMGDKLPELIPCAIVKTFVEYGRLD
jgi:hypothetical protein